MGKLLRLRVLLFGAMVVASGIALAMPGEPQPAPTRPPHGSLDPVPPTSSIECNIPADCNDGNACTNDDCITNTCVHFTIPGCVPCEDGQPCPPIDVVFVMDTSGSMKDEAAALCANIETVEQILAANGIIIHTTILGVDEAPGGAFECLSGNVVDTFGGTIPGNPNSCPFPNGLFPSESWGPGASIVAAEFPWTPNALRLICPVGDEAPCNGSFPGGCVDPGDDRDSVDNLITVAMANGVTVSPILGGGTDPCVFSFAQEIATATGGLVFQTSSSADQIAAAIVQLVGQACAMAGVCNDQNACTTGDTCNEGVCTGTQIPGCSPCVVDGDCDDLLNCTADRCVAGQCQFTNLNDLPCTSEADCLGAVCDIDEGVCECLEIASLCLRSVPGTLPLAGCFVPNDEIVVNVEVGPTSAVIAGGQFNIDYNPAVLQLLDITPGGLVEPGSPFVNEILRTVDVVQGRIFYAVGIEIFGQGIQGPAIMASLRFKALAACSSDELCLLDENPQHTLLTDMFGSSIPYEACCTGDIVIDGGPPVILNCPNDITVGADPGGVTAEVTWPSLLAADPCEGLQTLSCTAENSNGLPVQQLIANGGVFPPGVTTFECSTIDDCGIISTCGWAVEVTSTNLLSVEVQLSPTVVPGPLLRCITFELVPSCSEPAAVVETMMEFGLPLDLPGHAKKVDLLVPAGDYHCITARDAKHTLRATAPIVVAGAGYVASFEGDPVFGGNWLTGGNLDDNGTIDVIDFGYYMVDFLSTVPSGSGCEGTDIHADVNGDGLVDPIDGTFIISNYGTEDSDGCCPGGPAGSGAAIHDISTHDLRRMGLSQLRAGDLNRDGRLNALDIQAFAAGRYTPVVIRKPARAGSR